MNLSCIITITTDVKVQVKDNDTYHTVKFSGHLQREFFIVLVHTPVHDMSLCKSIYCYIESCTVHQFYLIFTQHFLTFSQIRHKFTNFCLWRIKFRDQFIICSCNFKVFLMMGSDLLVVFVQVLIKRTFFCQDFTS